MVAKTRAMGVVMGLKNASLVASALMVSVSMAQAQSLSRLGEPRNLPPISFTGQQFADMDGCVFLKAGFGGQVRWVPRISANRRPLCGYPPTFGGTVAQAAPLMPPATVVAQPIVAGLSGQPAVGEPIRLVPNTPPPAASPIQRHGAAMTPPVTQGARLTYAAAQTPRVTIAIPTPPRGYKLAWTDDRLNPARGLGTAAGQAQQDQVWTRTIPAVQVTAAQPRSRTAIFIMSATDAASGGAYVQVGTFGQPANADSARARLGALGLPVSTSQITRKGKALQIVFAGPFATTGQAQSALSAARAAGFGDAILR